MARRGGVVLAVSLAAVGAVSVAGCQQSGGTGTPAARRQAAPLPAGSYDVQSVQYDDASGEYRVHVLNAPAGTRPLFESDDLKLGRLTDEAVAAGKRATLTLEGGGATLLLPPDFQVAYVHNVTEERTDPATGTREVVVVRQDHGFWSPFAASMAGTMMANALFAPHYVYPPAFVPGGMAGVGAYGPTRLAAAESYRAAHGSLPQPARVAASGALLKRPGADALRPGPAGVGSSKWKNTPVSKPRPFGRPMGIRKR